MKLTAKGVEAAKPGPSRIEIPDQVVVGLYLVVQPSGAKAWAVRYRIDGKPKKFTLGPFPRIELAAAREAARQALALVDRGSDPAEQREEQKAEEARLRASTFEAIAAQFVELYARTRQPRSWALTKRVLERDLFPQWGSRPFTAIRRRDLYAILDAMDVAGRSGSKHHVIAAVSKLYNWAVDREIIDASPFAQMQRPPVGRRIRTLTDEEIRTLWRGCDGTGYPFGPYVKLLLLTGCRRTELARLEYSEVDRGRALIVIPGAKYKTGRAHIVPLSRRGQLVHDLMPPLACGRHLFSTTGGEKPISGFSKLKERLDKRLGFDWDLHDLRRTVRTGLSQLRIPREVAERVLGHVQRGVEAHYDHWEYLEEKREALEAWGKHVEAIIRRDDR